MVHLMEACACVQIVHGDLKSLNILLTRGWQLAKLGDVGVARYLKSKDVPDHVARESPAALSSALWTMQSVMQFMRKVQPASGSRCEAGASRVGISC
jgi:serine/threonine protein kinase